MFSTIANQTCTLRFAKQSNYRRLLSQKLSDDKARLKSDARRILRLQRMPTAKTTMKTKPSSSNKQGENNTYKYIKYKRLSIKDCFWHKNMRLFVCAFACGALNSAFVELSFLVRLFSFRHSTLNSNNKSKVKFMQPFALSATQRKTNCK